MSAPQPDRSGPELDSPELDSPELDSAVFDSAVFDDVLAGNDRHASAYQPRQLEGRAAKRLAVLTCMDCRIDPLAMLGLQVGDAKVLRNAGARVTDDVLRTLVLASYLLDVDRVMVVAHTDCRMAGGDEELVHSAVEAAGGPDTRSLSFLTTTDQERSTIDDVRRIRSWPYLPPLHVGGFVYDVTTGRLRQVC